MHLKLCHFSNLPAGGHRRESTGWWKAQPGAWSSTSGVGAGLPPPGYVAYVHQVAYVAYLFPPTTAT